MIMKSRIGLSKRGAAFWVKWVVLPVLCLGIICAVIFVWSTAPGRKDVADPALLRFTTADFDATVIIRETITDDFKRWGKENKFPISDHTNYQKTRFARLGDRCYAEESTFDKNDKLIGSFRAVTQFHTDKTTGVKSGTLTQYQYSPNNKRSDFGLIEAITPDFIPMFEMSKQAVYRHVLYDGVEGVVNVDPKTNDILDISRDNRGHVLKAIYSDYQTIDGRRIAKHLAFQMGTPDSGKLAKTVYTELIDFKSKPDPSIFLNIIPPGAEVRDSIKKIEYIQPKPGDKIVPLENCCF
jgi:hypothetical protein